MLVLRSASGCRSCGPVRGPGHRDRRTTLPAGRGRPGARAARTRPGRHPGSGWWWSCRPRPSGCTSRSPWPGRASSAPPVPGWCDAPGRSDPVRCRRGQAWRSGPGRPPGHPGSVGGDRTRRGPAGRPRPSGGPQHRRRRVNQRHRQCRRGCPWGPVVRVAAGRCPVLGWPRRRRSTLRRPDSSSVPILPLRLLSSSRRPSQGRRARPKGPMRPAGDRPPVPAGTGSHRARGWAIA
jgi:hypothetical protein